MILSHIVYADDEKKREENFKVQTSHFISSMTVMNGLMWCFK